MAYDNTSAAKHEPVVYEGKLSHDLRKRLTAYYKIHQPSKLDNVKLLAALYVFKQEQLSDRLKQKYGCPLPLQDNVCRGYKKPYVLFPRKVNHDITSPPVGKGKPFTSKYTGVTWHKRAHGWSANISKHSSITGKPCYIGIFNTQIEAAIAFDQSKFKIQNYPHRKLNFVKFPEDF